MIEVDEDGTRYGFTSSAKSLVTVGGDMAHALTLVTRAAATAASASQARDDAIREAHRQGASLRAIAAAAGLSFQRVHQILHGR